MGWKHLGIAIGHATNHDGGTGCTVVRGIDAPFRCASALLGRASGTRELATTSPDHLVDRTDAILLTGGSAYGLDAAQGVMRWMEERRRGFPVGPFVVPIVPAAVVFDLAPIGDPSARPDAEMAWRACNDASSDHVEEGAIGAGTGALVGKAAGIERAMKGGVGIAHSVSPHARFAALAVVNAFGDIRDAQHRIISGARADDGTFIDSRALLERSPAHQRLGNESAMNTTLVVVAMSISVDKTALAQVATAVTGALHRRISPVGSQFDGDVIFALCPHSAPAAVVPLAHLEAAAAAVVEEAIERGVRMAKSRDGFPGLAGAV